MVTVVPLLSQGAELLAVQSRTRLKATRRWQMADSPSRTSRVKTHSAERSGQSHSGFGVKNGVAVRLEAVVCNSN